MSTKKEAQEQEIISPVDITTLSHLGRLHECIQENSWLLMKSSTLMGLFGTRQRCWIESGFRGVTCVTPLVSDPNLNLAMNSSSPGMELFSPIPPDMARDVMAASYITIASLTVSPCYISDFSLTSVFSRYLFGKV